MAEGIVEQLESTLICPICSKVLDDARVLKCGHMFCFMCIKLDYERQVLYNEKCPVCGDLYNPKHQNIQYVAKAVIVNIMLAQLKCAVYQCSFCQSGNGSMVCLKCKLNMCKYCSKRTVSFCGHQTVTMEYLNTDPLLREILQRSKSKQTCPSHSDEDASHFCRNCKRVICNACFNETHRHHDVIVLHESVARIKNRNIPLRLEKKEKELEKFLQTFKEPKDTSAVVTRVPPTDKEKQLCQKYRDDCSVLHRQMSYLFMYGSGKAILELFYEQEADIDKLLNYDPTKETFLMTDPETFSKSKPTRSLITNDRQTLNPYSTIFFL